ncbi:hypothetical protein AB0875_12530 [Micromonospora gifhornensis]|uniref:hypothetical protein n=1 Tax=Micromonospora gifhornensis TaxID=84594 RepID=UPI003454DBAA
MGFQLTVTGGADLTVVRRQLRAAGDRRLSQQMARALQRAAKPLQPAVKASALAVLPSGYGPLMSRSVRVRAAARERRGAASVHLTVTARGAVEKRDVNRINAGVLRHPVFGRTRRLRRHAQHRATSKVNPWVAQRVRRGFVDRPADRLGPDVAREMQSVVDWVADTITKG